MVGFSCVCVCSQAGGGGRGVLHREHSGAEEPRAARPEHGRDLGTEEVMEDETGRPRPTDRPTPETGAPTPRADGGRLREEEPGGTKNTKTVRRRRRRAATLKDFITQSLLKDCCRLVSLCAIQQE